MSDPFDIENERIEIRDDEGNLLTFKPVAIIGNDEEMYYVFGAMKTLKDGHTRQMRLMFTKREDGNNGESRFVPCENEEEVEQIVGSYILQAMEEIAKKIASDGNNEEENEEECRMEHSFGIYIL